LSVQALDKDPLYLNFIYSLKSKITQENYAYALKKFMDFHSIKEYSSLMVDKEQKIKEYVLHLRGKEASSSQFKMLFATLKNFYEMNDVEDIKWKKLKRFVGEEIPVHQDRCYSREEIQILVERANLKLKATILLMASSGVRVGALPTLVTGHLSKRGDLYKIDVYKGLKGKGQYYTFCTPEAAKAIDNYLEFRERCGEKITPNSPLFRKDFDIGIHEQARNAIHIWTRESIIMALRTLLINNGLIEIDHVNGTRNRKEVKQSHGLRKFFETMLVNSNLHETVIRKLTGHSPTHNLTQLYSKQTEEEMLQEYSKAIDFLTINPENRLKRQVEILTVEKSKVDFAISQIEEMKLRLGLKC